MTCSGWLETLSQRQYWQRVRIGWFCRPQAGLMQFQYSEETPEAASFGLERNTSQRNDTYVLMLMVSLSWVKSWPMSRLDRMERRRFRSELRE